MGERSDGLLHRRLDRVEDRGRGALVAAARRDALAAAVTTAAAAAIPLPALLFLLAFVTPVAVVPAVLLALLVPIAVFGIIAWRRIARLQVDRGAALAWVDGALVSKDRATITAEFIDAPRDGFRAAALDEAAPWLDHAATAGIAIPEGVHGDVRRPLAMVAAALLLLIAALFVRPVAPETGAGPVATALRRAAMAIGLSHDRVADHRDRADAALSGPGGSMRDAAPAGSGGASGRGSAQPAGSLAAGSADRPVGMGGPAGASGPSEGDAGSASVSPGAPGANGSAASGAMATGDVPQGRGDAAADARDPSTDRGHGSATAAPESRATPASGAQGGAGSAMAGAPPASPRTGGQEAQQGSGSRSRQSSGSQANGSGSQSSANNGNQQGSTRGNGQEGMKRARGSTTLMLAVPMQDRLIGTVNAGAVSSTTREAPPRTMAAGVVAAQDRGAGSGQVGRIRHGGRTAQEDRVLERYFRRAGVDR